MTKKMRGNILLLITAVVWGISFVSQSVGMDYIEPNTFNGIRTMMGCIALLPVIAFRSMRAKKNGEVKKENKKAEECLRFLFYRFSSTWALVP